MGLKSGSSDYNPLVTDLWGHTVPAVKRSLKTQTFCLRFHLTKDKDNSLPEGLGSKANREGVHVMSSVGFFCIFPHTFVYALPS